MPMSASTSESRTRDSRSPGPHDGSRDRSTAQSQSSNGRQSFYRRRQSQSAARFDHRPSQSATPDRRLDSRQASQSPTSSYRRSSFNNDNGNGDRWSFKASKQASLFARSINTKI